MNHIYIKDRALAPRECRDVINWFERHSQEQQPGMIGSQHLDSGAKRSTDIPRWFRLQKLPEKTLEPALRKGGAEYAQERPHIFRTLSKMLVDDSYVLQRYLPNEGYYSLHCEVGGPANAARVLAWMFYLNDVPDGGTRFPDQDFDCEAKQGRLVVWPAYFTHMHQGIVSTTTTKYIVTGWVVWDGIKLE